MIKERIKSCLLGLLIVSSIVLTLNIWISGKLWSDGYNFFSNITNFFDFESKNKSYYLSKENISYPQRIIVNNNEQRNLYTHTSTQYNDIIPSVLDIFKSSISSAEFTVANPAEWNSSLKGKSAYVSYPIIYDSNLLWGILDIVPVPGLPGTVKDFIISVSEKNDETLNIYIKDYNTQDIYKANVSFSYGEFTSMIEKYAIDSINMLPYSFELNFDKSSDESVEQKIVLDPTVTLLLEESKLPVIESVNLTKDVYNDTEMSENILSSFGYNTTNIRKYLDSNNTAVYVENYSSIKIHENGLLEYKALDNTKGITLTNSASTSQHDIFIACIEFVNTLWDNAFPNEELNINLTSDIRANGKNFYITMDYYVDGYQAISNISANKVHSKLSHSIEITVAEGKIVEYRQLFNSFRTTNDYFGNGSAINAIDRMFADNRMENSTITELTIAYSKNGNKWYPTWSAKTTGGERIIIRR
ncbi:MAG: hypothetical protein IJ460_04175 [Clostridia bacterium]|nr:hypothetical protein [Clostridia bacterium]